MQTIIRLTIATAALAAAMSFNVPASRASFGNAPWCLMKFGDDVYWDCQYNSAQECLASIASGIRGACNVNPSPGPSLPAGQPGHRKGLARPH